ncbi:MAG: ribosome maturation factor RimP [Gemmatimonadales bacterium]
MSLDESLDRVLSPIREHIASLGFELVDLRRAGTLDRPILQLRVDRPDSRPGAGITAEECASVSRALERLLESRGLVGPRYVLEVSSPGIERPLRWPEHWRRAVGRRARIRAEGVPGRPEVEVLAVPDAEHVCVRLPDGSERTLALAAVREARLTFDWASAKPAKRR